MLDIYFGVVLMLLLFAACFVATRRMTEGLTVAACDALAALTVVLICGYIWWVWDNIRLAQWLPFSNLIVVGNWFLPMTGVLAGLAWRRVHHSAARRWLAMALLLGSGVYSTLRPVLGEPPRCDARWERAAEGRLILQTTESTCAAAAAATLLGLHGIPANEQEMASLCLTRDGTTWKGLFRGLVLKTSATEWNVEVVRGSAENLAADSRMPIVLCTRLSPDHPRAREYQHEWGWIPGMPHTVVVIGRLRQGEFVVHDPVAGKEVWTAEDLEALWTGEGMRLVARRGKSPNAVSLAGGFQGLFRN